MLLSISKTIRCCYPEDHNPNSLCHEDQKRYVSNDHMKLHISKVLLGNDFSSSACQEINLLLLWNLKGHRSLPIGRILSLLNCILCLLAL
jgi:hypothetical protein